LALNPDLGVAHSYYAQLEVDLGRAQDAMVRLIGRVADRSTDPELFAALVHACRYCGLLGASLAAADTARRLGSSVRTSVPHTHFLRGEYERVVTYGNTYGFTDVPYIYAISLAAVGREVEALAALRQLQQAATRVSEFIAAARALLEGDRDASVASLNRVLASQYSDPEVLLYAARQLAHLGARDEAISGLARAIEGGHFCYPALAHDPWFDSVRHDVRFVELLERARERHTRALGAFREAGGERVLGIADPV
jgi:predicted Zn-dependent protease